MIEELIISEQNNSNKNSTVKVRIKLKLTDSKRYVFIRADFKKLAGYDQIGRALRELVNEEQLLKVGYGVYTKARRNKITGKLMSAAPGGSAAVIIEALQCLNVDYCLVGATDAYNCGQSTQIPASVQIKIPKRFKRTLAVGNSKLNIFGE